MENLYCFVVGILFAIGVYLLLQRSMVKLLFGIMILSSAVNILIFVLGRISYGKPVFTPPGTIAPLLEFANPLSQALILTAIVIGFGLLTYCLVLIRCFWQQTNTLDVQHNQQEI
jgi:multicomponent Na+:H+ antiporter subunit C